MKYIDTIVPLPLEGTFTYSIPQGMEDKVEVGMRVLVPWGRSKTYVAIVARVHEEKPDFECKPISQMMDDKTVLLPEQMKLWRWIEQYYMSPIGEVYKAAFPIGLKAEDGYKPRTETCVSLNPRHASARGIHDALTLISRAKQQEKAFMAFLTATGWDMTEEGKPLPPVSEVTKEEVMNMSHCTAATMKALVDRGILMTYEREVGRLNNDAVTNFSLINKLNIHQSDAYDKILFSFLNKSVTLLHGVTSSGKTEIYIHLIKKMMDENKQVLYLLPEIALTVQMTTRLKRVFGNRLGIYHSKYSDAERVEIWKKQLSDNPYDVVLGARSAIFLPFQRLGLVIIDEEHETSFKQQDPMPRYHARSAAIMLASMYNAKVLLGTATPSMESWGNVCSGKYGYVTLFQRYKDIELPHIDVIDIADLQHRKMMEGPFSPQLIEAITTALARKEQVILFQNRRGYAPVMECRSCGWTPKCSACDVSLTVHKALGALSCHYCGTTYSLPRTCPKCGGTELSDRGYGTEKIEDTVARLFPSARLARMDLDTTRTRSAYERIINDFANHNTDILIGTQMISKGLDFDNVSTVGILNADSMLNIPDFRAYEHAFMMMAQVSGRAGRKGKQGRVLLQTKSPELPIVRQIVANDFSTFASDTMEERQLFHYPPFYRLIHVIIRHKADSLVESAAREMASRLRYFFGTRVLGPDKPSIARVKNMNIRKIVLKLENGIDANKVRTCLRETEASIMTNKRYGQVNIYFDVDPL